MWLWQPKVIYSSSQNDMEGNRSIRYTVRLTSKEDIEMKSAMELEGYKSVAKYIRHRLLSKDIRRRNLRIRDENLEKRFSLFVADMKKIGVNYNQVVKAVNILMKQRETNGRGTFSRRSMIQKCTELEALTKMMIDTMEKMSQEINDSNT